MKRLTAFAVCAVMVIGILMCLSSCGNSNNQQESDLNSQLIGKWKLENRDDTIEFFKDGSYLATTVNVEQTYKSYKLYRVYENHSIIFEDYGDGMGNINYSTSSYEIENDTLTIISNDGKEYRYKKQ